MVEQEIYPANVLVQLVEKIGKSQDSLAPASVHSFR